MTTAKAYEYFIIKINENATTDQVSCDKGRFERLYNNHQNKLIEFILERRFEDDIRYIQQILVEDKKLTSSNNHLDHQDFELPKDFFDFSNLYIQAIKGECKDKVDCFEIKGDDKNNILRDSDNNPSFKHRETPFTISSSKIQIFTAGDFTIDSAYFSYYRYPQQIGLVNPQNPESDFNSNNPEFDDKFVNRVIDLAASEFFQNNNDQKFQIAKVNAIQKP
jgi:hypothetical protein